MSIGLPINPGDPLLLSYLFEDGTSSLYVLASVYDKFDTPIAGSPFALTHIADGYYSNTSVIRPDGIYKAVYIVYEDAGHTIKSRRYSQEEDMFIVGLQTSVDYAAIADAVWDELNICTDHNLATSAGWLLCGIKAVVSDTNAKINTYLLPLLALLQQVNDRVEATSIAKAVWNAVRSAYQVTGTFGEALQGVISVSRAALIDNLTRLDVVVSTRAGQVTVDQVLYDTNLLNDKLTSVRAAKLDLIDVVLSSRASQASVDLKPNSDEIANAVWDEALGGHLVPGSTGEALLEASAPDALPSAIATAVWDEMAAGHVIPGSFGSRVDTPVSTRADKLDVAAIEASEAAILSAIGHLPTTAGDATLAKQNDILSVLAGKANQSTLSAVQSQVAAIPVNPVLATDPRVARLDAAVSSRATPSDIEAIKGAGWSAATDTLEKIRDAIPAPCDISTVMAGLAEIKGAGFSGATDSLAAISDSALAAQIAAEAADSTSLAALNAISGKANQTTVDAVLSRVNLIPANPVLATDLRLGRLDANISSRATQASIDEIMGAGFATSINSLKNLYDTLVASDHYAEIYLLLSAINSAIPSLARQTTLIDLVAATSAIPLDTVRTGDARLDNLDIPISTRLAAADFNIIKGAGYDVANDSLYAISQKINGVCHVSDINAIIGELAKIEGTGFTTASDSLKAANDKAIADRNVLKADLTALLSEGEGF